MDPQIVEDLVVLVVSFLASTLGPLCGIGGGVIIKPVIDALGVMGVPSASFLSGITVLVMALSTLAGRAHRHEELHDRAAVVPVALGGAVGGVLGKAVFSRLTAAFPAPAVGSGQASLTIALALLTIVYELRRDAFPGFRLRGAMPLAALGVGAGCAWAFLGIGGGPFNVALLAFFCGLRGRAAAEGSVFLIACSQTASLVFTLATGAVPEFSAVLLLGMGACGVAGSAAGSVMARRVGEKATERLYAAVLVLIVAICCFNIARFGAALG